MKKLLFILSILFSFGVHSQTFTPIHNYQAPDALDVVKFLGIPYGATPSLNGVNRPNGHPLFYNTTDSSLYLYSGNQWIIVGGGNSSAKDTVNVGYGLNVTWDSTGHQLLFADHPDGYEGGIVSYAGTGFNFNISPITLYLHNNVYQFPATTLTLSPPNSEPRYDIFGVDSSGAFVKMGDSAALPIEPQVGIDSFALTKAFLISPGDTAPSNIGMVIIYDEHTINEYTAGYEGAASTIDFNNTDNPKHISKATYISSYHNGAQWYFYDPTYTRITPQSDQVITGWVYLNDSTTNNFAVFLADSNLTTTNYLYLSDYGIDRNNPNVYQQFSIPVNNFYFHGTGKYTTIEFQAIGSDTSGAGGLYMDYINLQSGVQNTLQSTDYSNKQDSNLVRNDSLFWVAKGIEHFVGKIGGGTTDTTSLSDRIDLKLNISDTASMLSPYLRKNALAAGTNISLAGTGTDADPIVINASGGASGVDSTAYHTSQVIGDSLLVICDLQGRCDTIAMSSINLWQKNGNKIYYNSGNVGIGTDTASAKLVVRKDLITDANANDSMSVMLSNLDTTNILNHSIHLIFRNYGKISSGSYYDTRVALYSQGNTGVSSQYPNFYLKGSKDGGVTYPLSYATFSPTGVSFNGSLAANALNGNFGGVVTQWTAGYIDVTNYVHAANIAATTRLDVGTSTPNYSAINNVVSTTQGFLPPRMTTVQRDSISLVVTGVTITNGGSYTGTPTVTFSSTNGYVLATGTAVKTGSAVTSVTITNGGIYYKTPTISFTGGTGSGATATAVMTQQLTTGLTIFCTDCTATDSSTGVMQTWTGSSWKNNW